MTGSIQADQAKVAAQNQAATAMSRQTEQKPLASLDPADPGGYTLGQRASFWVAAAVVVHTLWTSAAPAMTYPLYASEWHLTPTVTTAIFAVYPLVVVSVLLTFGGISDYIGRRLTMLLGLGASLVGVLLFATAPNVNWIFLGRAFMGVGVGLSAAPSAAAMVEFSPPGQADRAGSITTAAQALGLALAMLMGGALIAYAPLPTRLNFWVLSVVLAVLFLATWFLPRRSANKASGRWQPKLFKVPRGLYLIFATSAAAVSTGYALGALFMSLGAQIAHDLIGSGNAFVNGAAMSVFSVVSASVAFFAKRLAPSSAMILGGVASTTGMGLLVLSSSQHSLAIFLAAIAAGGIGYSLAFLGGLNLINASAPVQHRGGTLSAVLLVAYLMQGVIAILLGMLATAWGLRVAVELGSAAIAVLSIIGISLAARRAS
jgi:predicted MFS family arabinose efflux permease